MPRGDNRTKGIRGEDAAADFLYRKGLRLLERNYRCPAGEVDLIVEERGTIVFVEVKARSPESRFAPEEAVDGTKQERLRAAARYYLKAWRDAGPLRFDIVSVFLDKRGSVSAIEHHEDAFRQ